MKPEKINNLLVAVDFTNADDSLLSYTDFIVERLQVKNISFVHVVPTFDFFKTLSLAGNEDLREVWFLDEAMEAKLKEKVSNEFGNIVNKEVSYQVLEGEPLAEVLRIAKEKTSDLIIIGQKAGKQGHGILARNLARKIERNALIIPEQAKLPIEKVLVPIDFSDNSGRALQAAVEVGKQLNPSVKVIALNIYEVPSISTYRLNRTPEQFREMVKGHIEGAFNEFITKYAPNEVDRIETALVEREFPSIAHYVIEYAKEHQVGLIALGAKGHSTVERLFIGSVTERVLSYNEQIPTFVVK